MFGWQLRHDPQTSLFGKPSSSTRRSSSVYRMKRLRSDSIYVDDYENGPRVQFEKCALNRSHSQNPNSDPSQCHHNQAHPSQQHQRKFSDRTVMFHNITEADEERRRLLPTGRRRTTLATANIPEGLFLTAGASTSYRHASASSKSSSFSPFDDVHEEAAEVRATGRERDRDDRPDTSNSTHSHTRFFHFRHFLENDENETENENETVQTSLLADRLIEEEDNATGGTGPLADHGRGRQFDIAYADQSELEDLLAIAASVKNAESKDGCAGQTLLLGKGEKELHTDLTVTLPDLSESKEDLEEEGESSESEESENWTRQARVILTHVGLVVLTCAYTLIGAAIFYRIEQPYEAQVKRQSLDAFFAEEKQFMDDMYAMARSGSVSEEEWRNLTHDKMLNMTGIVYEAFERYFLTWAEIRENKIKEIWTFQASVFFAATVVTTIGYGNPVPITFPGRLVCVFFALFGIPLTLLTIANVGKFFGEHLLWLYSWYLRLTQKLEALSARFRKSKKSDCEKSNKCGSGNIDGPVVCEKCRRPSQDNRLGLGKPSLSDIDLMDIPQKTVPATVVISILIGYTALGGLIFCNIEEWDFFEAFYFSFVTMTTIGFGDLVPRKVTTVLILLYIVFGLAITTMCIDLVGAHYVRKIHYFGRKIQDARSALAIVGGKVVYVGELYAQLMSKRYGLRPDQMTLIPDAFIIENLYLTKHLIPFIPRDIKRIRYIDETSESFASSSTSLADTHSCRYCHRMSITTSHYSQSRAPTGHHQKHSNLRA